jgi:hypothetical protein
VTLPPPEQPPTLLDEARDALYAALQRVWVALGWPEERAERLPPATVRAPAAWVDVPVMHQAPTEGGQTFAATFPVVFVVDGAEQSQVEMQDKLLAYGWQQLDRVKLGDPGRQRGVLVQSFGPEDVDTGGGGGARAGGARPDPAADQDAVPADAGAGRRRRDPLT